MWEQTRQTSTEHTIFAYFYIKFAELSASAEGVRNVLVLYLEQNLHLEVATTLHSSFFNSHFYIPTTVSTIRFCKNPLNAVCHLGP